MTNWTSMSPVAFDATLVKGKKAREFARTAGDTMFPDLMPEPERASEPVPAQLPGQAGLFGEDE